MRVLYAVWLYGTNTNTHKPTHTQTYTNTHTHTPHTHTRENWRLACYVYVRIGYAYACAYAYAYTCAFGVHVYVCTRMICVWTCFYANVYAPAWVLRASVWVGVCLCVYESVRVCDVVCVCMCVCASMWDFVCEIVCKIKVRCLPFAYLSYNHRGGPEQKNPSKRMGHAGCSQRCQSVPFVTSLYCRCSHSNSTTCCRKLKQRHYRQDSTAVHMHAR